MDKETAEKEIKARWRELWQADKGKGLKSGIVCPAPGCGNGSGSDGDGVRLIRGTEYALKCHKCGLGGTALDFLGAETGAPIITTKDSEGKYRKKADLRRFEDYKRAMDAGAARLGFVIDWNEKPVKHKTTNGNRPRNDEKGAANINTHGNKKNSVETPEKDFTAYLEKARDGFDDARAVEYLEGRGLDIETCRAWLGFDESWVNPAGGSMKSPRIIGGFYGNKGYFARALNDEKGCKQIGGSDGVFGCVDALDGCGVIYVCEGWADALSVMQNGYKAIAINGNQKSEFIRIAEEKGFCGHFVLVLDNDEGGAKGVETLTPILDNAGFSFSVGDACGGHKDINEFLQKDPDGLNFVLMCLDDEAKAAAAKIAAPDSLNEYITSGKWREDCQRRAKTTAATGFPALDEWLHGGLFEGLTVISGFPSLGKTSLMWQAAENVASAGYHVLFFSLELSRQDMTAKSLSRRAFLHGRDITSADIESDMDGCATELQELLQEVGQNLEIIEGGFGYLVSDIRKRAKVARRRYENLVIFIDYLQAVADFSGKSDVVAIGETAKNLRQLARELHCPIVAASSTARSGYNAGIDYNSFYGSGQIESAADVAAGLQLALVYEKDFIDLAKEKDGKTKQAEMIDKALQADSRDVIFVGLKNRAGVMRKKIRFNFDARHCNFEEAVNVSPFTGSRRAKANQSEKLTPSQIEDLLAF